MAMKKVKISNKGNFSLIVHKLYVHLYIDFYGSLFYFPKSL